MKHRILLIAVVAATCTLFCGCASTRKPSKRMEQLELASVPTAPPPGQTLVCIHRPKAFIGYKLYTGIWDGPKFIGDLGSGQSIAYVCAPGEHYFINLSVEETGCIETKLLPDKTYDLYVAGGYGVWIASFKIEPLHQDDKTREKVAKWTQNDRWVVPGTRAESYEQAKQDQVRQVQEEFISGKRKSKLQHMDSEDYR